MKFILILCLLAVHVHGHGMVLDPVNRASRWRVDPSAPANYNDNELFCGGVGQLIANGGKCGMCGDNYAHSKPRAHELGGMYGQGVVVKSYPSGTNMNVDIRITANHRGLFEFRLCNMDRFGSETEACYEDILLASPSGETQHPFADYIGNHEVVLKLPSGLTCKHCILQWSWVAHNTGEFYRTCSDITIV